MGSSSAPAEDNHLKSLGFVNGTKTQMFTKDKKARLRRKSTRALSRSLFKKRFTHKDQCASMEVNKEEKKNDDDVAKKLLKEFVETAKARARTAGQ